MKEVKVYSTPGCPWCTRAKQFFEEKNVPYKDIDVSRDREQAMVMVEKSGQRGVPVIEIDGRIIIGFDQEAIEEAIKAS